MNGKRVIKKTTEFIQVNLLSTGFFFSNLDQLDRSARFARYARSLAALALAILIPSTQHRARLFQYPSKTFRYLPRVPNFERLEASWGRLGGGLGAPWAVL